MIGLLLVLDSTSNVEAKRVLVACTEGQMEWPVKPRSDKIYSASNDLFFLHKS